MEVTENQKASKSLFIPNYKRFPTIVSSNVGYYEKEYDNRAQFFDMSYSSKVTDIPITFADTKIPLPNKNQLLIDWLMKKFYINKSIIQDETYLNDPVTSNIVCQEFFRYLDFFDFAALERVSSHFIQPILRYLTKRYSFRRRELFENFDLEFFLMNIDSNVITDVPEKPKAITIYELCFVLKHFGAMMKKINIQLKYVKRTREIFDETDLSKNSVILEEIISKYTDKKHVQSFILGDHSFSLDSRRRYIWNIDIQYEISLETLSFQLDGFKYLTELKLLTDYSQIDRTFLIKEYLEKINVKELVIQGAGKLLNQDCDDIITAIAFESLNSLKKIKIISCSSQHLFSMLNKFNNIDEVTLDNINYYGLCLIADLSYPKLRTLSIQNCPYIDDHFCYELIKKNNNLHYFEISNSDNVDGSFLNAINDLENRNIALQIEINNLRKDFLPSINKIQIKNKFIAYSCIRFVLYNEKQIDEIIKDLYDEVDTGNSEYDEFTSKNKVPYGFGRILRKYFRSDYFNFHLDLSDFYNLNENCLKYILTLSNIDTLSLSTYYPKISNEKLVKFLKEIKVTTANIYGYKHMDFNSIENCCDHTLQGLVLGSGNSLGTLKVSNCSIGELFFKQINKFHRMYYVMLNNVSGFSKLNMKVMNKYYARELTINNCPEFNDEMCKDMIQHYLNLTYFRIHRCDNITGSFLNKIHINDISKVFIDDLSAFICNSEEELEIKENMDLSFRITNNVVHNENEKENEDKVQQYDIRRGEPGSSYKLIYDYKFFTKLFQLKRLNTLITSTFYLNVNVLQNLYLLNIKNLELINNKFHENDATVDILQNFSIHNPECLENLTLKKCKINELGITAINQFKKLKFLTFESMAGLSNEILLKLSLKKLHEINILDNDEINDSTCARIIQGNYMTLLNIAKCNKITENLLGCLKSVYSRYLKIDVSATKAGYYCICKDLFQCHDINGDIIKILNPSCETYIKYLKKIFTEVHTKPTETELPKSLIKYFSQDITLDLNEWTELDDWAFELIPQLYELGTIKIRTHYKNVTHRKIMINSLLKLHLHTIIIEEHSVAGHTTACSDILDALSINQLEEISLINCQLNEEILEILCSFKELRVLRIFYNKIYYETDIIEKLKSIGNTLYALYINDNIIENTY